MRRSRATSIHLAFVIAVLVAPARAEESRTLRAAVAGVSPEFCPALRVLLGGVPSGFTTLRGAPRAGGENMWNGTKALPGGGECTAFGGNPPAYVCTLYAGDVEDNADGAYDRAVAGVKNCLPSAAKATEKVDGVHARTTTLAGDATASIRVVSRDVSADAYLVELWVDAIKH
jgi:hypothetical protein